MDKDILLLPAGQFSMRWPVNFIEEDIEEFRNEQVYTTNDTYLQQFHNVRVSADSVIYKNGLLLKASLPAKRYIPYYRFRHLFKNIFSKKNVILSKEKKYLLVTDLWSGGHFHWFCDILPKLYCVQDRASDFTLLLPDRHYLKKVAYESLRLLGFSFEDIVWMKEENFYKINHLYFIPAISPSGRMHAELVKKLRDRFTDNQPIGTKRIYISRHKSAFRKVLNEEELFRLLQQYNFELLYAEDLGFTEQVNLFSKTEVLLGIHGAGLTNAIFMRPGSKIIELRKRENGSSNVGYWHLADSLDHLFYYYNGIPDSEMPLVGKGCNLTIPVKDFEKKILEKI